MVKVGELRLGMRPHERCRRLKPTHDTHTEFTQHSAPPHRGVASYWAKICGPHPRLAREPARAVNVAAGSKILGAVEIVSHALVAVTQLKRLRLQ